MLNQLSHPGATRRTLRDRGKFNLHQHSQKMGEILVFFFLKNCLFIHERHTERGRDTGRWRSRLHAGSLMWDSISGPPGSCPGPKAGARLLSHPGIPLLLFYKDKLHVYLFKYSPFSFFSDSSYNSDHSSVIMFPSI